MLRWKIFAVFCVLLGLAWITWGILSKASFEPIDALGLPIDLISLIGLVTYAFALPSMPQKFWRLFHPVFATWAAIEIARAVMEEGVSIAVLVGVPIYLLIEGFNWLALYRLAGSPWSSKAKHVV